MRLSCSVSLGKCKLGFPELNGTAGNFKKLEHCLEQWGQECARKVYRSIFGREAIDRLTPMQKKFLMLA